VRPRPGRAKGSQPEPTRKGVLVRLRINGSMKCMVLKKKKRDIPCDLFCLPCDSGVPQATPRGTTRSLTVRLASVSRYPTRPAPPVPALRHRNSLACIITHTHTRAKMQRDMDTRTQVRVPAHTRAHRSTQAGTRHTCARKKNLKKTDTSLWVSIGESIGRWWAKQSRG